MPVTPKMPPPKPMGMPKYGASKPADDTEEEAAEASGDSMVPACIEMLDGMTNEELDQVVDAVQAKLAGSKPSSDTEVSLD